jgi:N-acetylglucosaminyldiphosphoundecaprenol N-acetyl-beta-D-mannosaminyltransferase
MSQRKVCTGLVAFDDLTLAESAANVKSLSEQPYFSYVVTPNIDHLSRLCSNSTSQTLKPIYANAALTLCDSRVLSKLLALIGRPVNNVVPGSDLTQFLFDHLLKTTDTILVVGGDDKDINALRNRYPSLVVQHINPSMGFINKPSEVDSLTEKIKEVAADYLFLAVGSPRQEILAYRLQQTEIKKGVALCIGASINFIVGVESRAPLWMQYVHMEWFYRMLQDPKRLFRRYASNALSIPRVLYALRSEKLGG